MECGGARSCSSSDVYIEGNDTTIYLSGSLSAANTVFTVDRDGSGAHFIFNGGYSGYNATIICQRDNICTIDCWGNGCNQLTAECGVNDTCLIIPNCDNAEKSDFCPNGVCSVRIKI